MNRAELVAAVTARTGISATAIDQILGAVADEIIAQMEVGETVNIRNFGKFVPKKRAAMRRVHPTTGAPIEVPPQMTVTFTPSTTMKDRINP